MPSAVVEKAARAAAVAGEAVEAERVAVAADAEPVVVVVVVVGAEPVAAVLDADGDMGVSHAVSSIRRHSPVRFRDLPQNASKQIRRFPMSSKKKYILQGVSTFLLPLVISIVSKMINRYFEKSAIDAPEDESETYTRIRKA